jgi:hypothetical protein
MILTGWVPTAAAAGASAAGGAARFVVAFAIAKTTANEAIATAATIATARPEIAGPEAVWPAGARPATPPRELPNTGPASIVGTCSFAWLPCACGHHTPETTNAENGSSKSASSATLALPTAGEHRLRGDLGTN